MMTVFLGIDVSTTASKALLIDEHGAVIASTSSAHTLQTPKPLWSEQNPEECWRAVVASIWMVLEKAWMTPIRSVQETTK
jgi:xylulokinase